MRKQLLLLCNVYVRPTRGFATFAEQPPFGIALALLLLFGVVTAFTGLHPGPDTPVRYAQMLQGDTPLYRQSFQYDLTFLQLLFGAALVTWLLARLFREQIRLDVAFTTLVFACLPWLAVALFYPLAVQSWLIYRIEMLLAGAALLWISALIGIGLRAACGLPRWKSVLISVSLVATLWGLGLFTLSTAPATFAITYPFRRCEQGHVVVYYPRDKDPGEIGEIARQTETTLLQVCQALAVKPPRFKVGIYLFPDDKLHKAVTEGDDDPAETDYAFHTCVTMPYSAWKECDNSMAHELTHVVAENQLAPSVHGLIDEGLANYVASVVAPDPEELPAVPSTNLPLRALARSEIFYDWTLAEDNGGTTLTHYAHAQGLVGYLIERYGQDRFKTFYCNLSDRSHGSANEGDDLANAAEEIFGVPLTQIETDWRKAKTPLKKLGAQQNPPLLERP